jgi:hypothetical protein
MLPKDSIQSIGHASHVLRSSIVFRNRSGATKSRRGLNRLHFSAAISARRRWVIVSMYDLSSPMCYHILGFATRFCTCIFLKYLCFFTSGFLSHFLVGFAPFFIPEMIGLRKLFVKLGYCRTLCSLLRGQVVNYSQCFLTILLS